MSNGNDSWTAALMRGDFDTAWKIRDEVLAERLERNEDCSEWARDKQFIWRGQPFANRRVLVRCYHGLGDTIQFIRFAAPLREIAREVTVWVQPELLSLIATAPGVDRVSALHDGKPEFLYDVDFELTELPHALRTTFPSVATHVPYVFPRMTSRVPQSDSGLLKVGIAWRGGSGSSGNAVPFEEFTRLQEIEGIELYSLEYPRDADELRRLGAIDLACKEIELLASRMQKLDLIVTVDSYLAHLAGAMGLRVWTLLPANSDWRWMEGRSDSPWYPSMQLFRQAVRGDWSAVMDEVMTQLPEYVLLRDSGSIRRAGPITSTRFLR